MGDVPECDEVELIAAPGARCGAIVIIAHRPLHRPASCIIEPARNLTPTPQPTRPYLFYKGLVKADNRSLLNSELSVYSSRIYTRSFDLFPTMASRKKVLLKVQSPHLLRVTSIEFFKK
jgi:hypothetical protein